MRDNILCIGGIADGDFIQDPKSYYWVIARDAPIGSIAKSGSYEEYAVETDTYRLERLIIGNDEMKFYVIEGISFYTAMSMMMRKYTTKNDECR